MRKSAVESTSSKVLYVLFSFILSMLVFFFILLVVLQATFLNKNFVVSMINDSNYFTDLSSEITEELIDLGNASGMDEDFFDNFIDEVILRDDIEKYINSFYTGKDITVDTTRFKQHFNEKLDIYIAQQELTVSQEAQHSLTNTVNEASEIYAARVALPYFELVAGYFYKLLSPLFYVTVGCGILIFIIAAILYATNKWKHRAYRYLSYCTLGAFLMTIAVPVAAYAFNKLDKLAIMSRALFNLYYSCITSFLNAFFVAAGILALLSVFFIYMHNRSRKKAIIGGA